MGDIYHGLFGTFHWQWLLVAAMVFGIVQYRCLQKATRTAKNKPAQSAESLETAKKAAEPVASKNATHVESLTASTSASLSPVTFAEIDQMEGREFERFLKSLFEQQGYQVKLTAYYDWGGDLIIEKNGVTTLIQAKRWKHRVKMQAVQEVVAAKAKYRAEKAMVVTNSHFTYQAQELAQANDVVLWNRTILAEQLQLFPVTLPIVRAAGGTRETKPTNPVSQETCAICQKPVSENVADYCRTNAPRFDGKIYCFAHQKASVRRQKSASAKPVGAAH